VFGRSAADLDWDHFAMKIDKLDIGCAISGVDATTITATQTQDILKLLYEKRLIVLKDQQASEEQFCDFARSVARPEPYLQDNYHHPKFPLIFVSSNVKQEGRQIGVARTGGYWHSDTSFEQTPKVITMLMPKVLPKQHARTTRFIDMAEVFQALPQATKDRLAKARFVHSGRWHYKIRPENVGQDMQEIMAWIDSFAPPASHPAVINHPFTGEPILYANRGFTVGIEGWSKDEQDAMLREIFDFAETPRFVREVQWSMGDIIIWDNRFLSHRSGRNDGPEEPTMMHRITARDAYPLSAPVLSAAA
jgi:taurine dioxygenase